MSDQGPIRVLHIFNRMDRGGAETWIVNVMRQIDRERFHFDFLVESDQPGAYDDEIRAMGGALYHAGSPKHLLRFARAFHRIVRQHGPYAVVHSHVHHASGFMLMLAAWQGIPIRIAHSHTDSRRLHEEASPVRRLYHRTAELLIVRFATIGFGVSRNAAASLFGERWDQDPRRRVLPCGIDLEPFATPVDRDAVRARLGLPANAFVVGHVGRFDPVKNHAFLVDVFARVHAERPDARLLLVGDGPMRDAIGRKVSDLGLAEAVVFAGNRPDVADVLRGGMDVFVFPSTWEGLGLAVIEAQAAGLPSVISDGLPAEASILPNLVEQISLHEPLERWAVAIVKQSGAAHEPGEHAAVENLIESPFHLRRGIDSLERAYLGS